MIFLTILFFKMFKLKNLCLAFVCFQECNVKKYLFLTIFIFILLIVGNFISVLYQQSFLKLFNTHQPKSSTSQLILFQRQLKAQLSYIQKKHIKHRQHLSTNLAIEFYQERKSYNYNSTKEQYINVKYCENVQLTSPLELLHNNFYWQVLKAPTFSTTNQSSQSPIYLMNAYYDDRRTSSPIVLIIAESKRQLTVAQKRFWYVHFVNKTSSAQINRFLFHFKYRPGAFSGLIALLIRFCRLSPLSGHYDTSSGTVFPT